MSGVVRDRLLEELKQFAEMEERHAENLNRARQWFHSINPFKERLDQLIHSLDFDALPDDWRSPLAEVEHEFKRLEHIPDLPHVSTPGWHLRTAWWDVMAALQNAEAGNIDAATSLLKTARIELGLCEIELFRQGIASS